MPAPTILMVEPNPGILIVARNVLTRAGFEVLAVSNARQGLKLSRQRRLDVALLDAKQSDPETLVELASSRTPAVPVILTVQKGSDMSADIALRAAVNGIEVEISEVLEKPFPPDRLLRAVERAQARRNDMTEPFLGGDILQALREELEDVSESDQTDVFPFAALLQNDLDPLSPATLDDHDTQSTYSLRAARIEARLRRELGERKLLVHADALDALVRVAEATVSDEVQRAGVDLDSQKPGSTLAAAGRIEHLPIDQIIQLGASVEGPSRCRIEHEGAAIEIYYRGSQVVFARQDNLHDGFMLGRLLVSSGLVDQRALDRSLDPRMGMTGRIGQRLVKLGYLSAEALRESLRRQSEELIFEAVRWKSGRFSIYAKDKLPSEAEGAGVAIPIQHLLLEGMRRLDEWHRLEGSVGDPAAIIARLSPDGADDLIRSLRPDDRMILESIDGRRTLRDLVRASRRPGIEVLRAVQVLAGHRLVAVPPRGSA